MFCLPFFEQIDERSVPLDCYELETMLVVIIYVSIF